MKADIKLIGPVRFGPTMYELQAEITCANGVVITKQWSQHHQISDAVEYMQEFNSFQAREKKP
jgi:hypothetical protein